MLTCASVALAQGTYTQLDFPGATGTLPSSVNSGGDIVGGWLDSNFNTHGFYLSNGVYTSIDYPGASDTITVGINDEAQVVGYALPSQTGFLYHVQTKTFTTLIDPEATGTLPSSINDAGVISGLVYTTSGTYVFTLVNSTYTLIPAPALLQGEGRYFWVAGITGSGNLIVAGETASGIYQAYINSNGIYAQIPLPTKTQFQVFGVNPQGTAYVGAYPLSTLVTAGFVDRGGNFTTLQFPGELDTNAEGINRYGEVVGVFTSSVGKQHGFTWTPSPVPGR